MVKKAGKISQNMEQKTDLPYPRLVFYIRCLRPKYLIPAINFKSIAEIPLEDLKSRGITALVFDVDQTLSSYGGTSLDPRICDNFKKLTREFKSCILSNTNLERRTQLEGYFGIPAVQTSARKPQPQAFLDALAYLQSQPQNTAMIGDKLLSDISGANRVGMLTIKLEPLRLYSEPFKETVIRKFTDFLCGFYRE